MDAGTLGTISTVLVAVAFAGVCWWAFAPRRKNALKKRQSCRSSAMPTILKQANPTPHRRKKQLSKSRPRTTIYHGGMKNEYFLEPLDYWADFHQLGIAFMGIAG